MMRLDLFRALLVGVLALICTAGAAVAEGLPGGATSLSETHGEWTVACRTAEERVTCVISQSQINGESRQRVLAVELMAGEGGSTASGLLVLPFGLRLASGVVLAVDEERSIPRLDFSTCLPAGCLVPLAFDAGAVTALKIGADLTLSATANDSGRDVAFSIPLAGFRSALERAAELTNP